MIGPRPLLIVTAVAEAITGLFLILAPALVVRLLLGSLAVDPPALARICGIALLAISVGCWPRQSNRSNFEQQCHAMLLYNAGVGVLLAYAGFFGPTYGVLLWP